MLGNFQYVRKKKKKKNPTDLLSDFNDNYRASMHAVPVATERQHPERELHPLWKKVSQY